MASTPNRIHFVSRYNDRAERGYKDLGGGLFSTEAWAVSAVEVTPSGSRLPKWRFTVRRNPLTGVTWPGAQGGGPEKAYV